MSKCFIIFFCMFANDVIASSDGVLSLGWPIVNTLLVLVVIYFPLRKALKEKFKDDFDSFNEEMKNNNDKFVLLEKKLKTIKESHENIMYDIDEIKDRTKLSVENYLRVKESHKIEREFQLKREFELKKENTRHRMIESVCRDVTTAIVDKTKEEIKKQKKTREKVENNLLYN